MGDLGGSRIGPYAFSATVKPEGNQVVLTLNTEVSVTDAKGVEHLVRVEIHPHRKKEDAEQDSAKRNDFAEELMCIRRTARRDSSEEGSNSEGESDNTLCHRPARI